MQHLVPHLEKAFHINYRFQGLIDQAGLAQTMLDQLPFAVFFFDDGFTPKSMNRQAEDLLSDQQGLSLSNGKIRANTSKDTDQLHRLIRQNRALAKGKALEAESAFRLWPEDTSSPCLNIVVSPLTPKQSGQLFEAPRPGVVMLVSSKSVQSKSSPEILKSLFHLTPAEIRLVDELLAGADLAEISDKYRISKHTVRAQLRTVLQKTDSSRQAELVMLMTSIPKEFEDQG